MRASRLFNFSTRFSVGDFSDLRQEDWLALFFLALYAGAYALLVLIAVFLPGGHTEQEESILFVLGWLLVPAFSLLSVRVWIWVRRRFLGKTADPLPLQALLGVNSLLFVLFTTGFNLIWHWFRSASVLASSVYAAAWLIPLINAGAVWVLRHSRGEPDLAFRWAVPLLGGAGFLNFVGFFPYFFGQYSTPLSLLAPAVMVGIGSLFLHWPKKLNVRNRVLLHAIDLLVIVLIVLACFDPTFQIAPEHQNFYLGPINRVLHGGSMLVDAFSQYGVLVIYFLAFSIGAGMIPLTYHGLSLAMALLTMLQFSLVYLLLVALVKDRFYAILLLALALLLGVFATIGTSQAYPSTGPLRFGLAYLLLAIVFLRSCFPRLHRAGLIVEPVLVGVASLWSFETFVYTVCPYLGICLFESLSSSSSLGSSLRRFLSRVAWLALALVGSHGLFAVFTYVRAGAWPDWATYLDFMKTYTVGGLGTELVDPWGPWVFPIGICFASLMVFLFHYFRRKNLQDSPHRKLVLGLTLFGIVQYTYFLGRSHPNNLFHISTPPLLIAGFWLVQVMSQDGLPAPLRGAARFYLFTAAAFILLTTVPTFAAKYQLNHTGFRFAWRTFSSAVTGGDLAPIWTKERNLLVSGSGDPQVLEALELLKEYAPAQEDATVLLSNVNTTEILMMSGRAQQLPINDLVADSISPRITARILQSGLGLQPTDVILIAHDPVFYRDQLYGQLEIQVLSQICQAFALHELKHTLHGVAAVLLEPYNGSPSSYCETIQSFVK
jgi:hypothetical protein